MNVSAHFPTSITRKHTKSVLHIKCENYVLIRQNSADQKSTVKCLCSVLLIQNNSSREQNIFNISKKKKKKTNNDDLKHKNAVW